MTVLYYQSTDASAPTIYGKVEVGNNLVNLLRKILVDGYGAKTAAGWTMPYGPTGNTACFLQGGAGGMYLAVDDTAALYARVVGYETMSSATAGTKAFPTTAQLAGGGYTHRSTTSDTVVRPWVCIADSTFFCLVINGDSLSNQCQVLMFGDCLCYRASDAYHKLLVCGTTATYGTSCVSALMSGIGTAVAGHWMARSYTQLGAAITLGQHTDTAKYGLTYPHPVDGGLYLGPMWLHENALSVVRGVIRGVWVPLHSPARPLSHMDTFSGTGALAGKTFVSVYVNSNLSLFLETSDTW